MAACEGSRLTAHGSRGDWSCEVKTEKGIKQEKLDGGEGRGGKGGAG